MNDSNNASFGEVFTQRWVVEAILDLVGYTPDEDLATKLIVEPSIGSGAFIAPIVERLLDSAQRHKRSAEEIRRSLFGIDLQTTHVKTCARIIKNLLKAYNYSNQEAEILTSDWLRQGDFLLDQIPINADFVVGNPPYIRSENLSNNTEKKYRQKWKTMRGRADIYIGFFERGLSILRTDGSLSYICADRWMHNAYGKNLRRLITEQYSMESVWEMHEVNAFEKQVSAYPAITLIKKSEQAEATYINTSAQFDATSAKEVLNYITSTRTIGTGHGWDGTRLDNWFHTDSFWPSGSVDMIRLIEHLQAHFPAIESTGNTKISIGVATGNDSAFLLDIQNQSEVESDRILPLVTADDIRKGHLEPPSKVLINPWSPNGTLVNLDDYPLLSQAFARRPQLRNRYVAKKYPSKWYRTIDKVHFDRIAQPKLLFQDMKAQITPIYEPGGLYPHHNLYYIISDTWDLEVLGGILLSKVAEAFVHAYGVKMRGGTLRFQAQYLRTIAVPSPHTISPKVAQALKEAFRKKDRSAADLATEQAYSLPAGTVHSLSFS